MLIEQSKIKTALNNPLQKFFQEHGKKIYFLKKFGLGMGSEKKKLKKTKLSKNSNDSSNSNNNQITKQSKQICVV